MATTRDGILDATCRLIEVQGFQATGLNQILQESAAPRGSLYHYFPGGKEALLTEAIERTGAAVALRLERALAEEAEPGDAIEAFVLKIARLVRASNYQSGGPLMTTALEAAGTSERLRVACSEAYLSWQRVFERRLRAGGIPAARCQALVQVVMAALDGAVVLARTHRTTESLEVVAREMRRLIEWEQNGGEAGRDTR